MTHPLIDDFITSCKKALHEQHFPADCVRATAPLMNKLVTSGVDFLDPQHLQNNPDNYSRNAIYIDGDNELSLFCMVWLPGQWTPIHDHGAWGVIGVWQGTLMERNYVRSDTRGKKAMEGVQLLRGGVTYLSEGSVTSFVPNPDHIHATGNDSSGERAISLHLYGRVMTGFHTYDRDSGTRQWFEASHNE